MFVVTLNKTSLKKVGYGLSHKPMYEDALLHHS